MAHEGIMADMLYNALRRKYAAAQAAGDHNRMARLREMMKRTAIVLEIGEPVTIDDHVTHDLGSLWTDARDDIRHEAEGLDVETTEEPEE